MLNKPSIGWDILIQSFSDLHFYAPYITGRTCYVKSNFNMKSKTEHTIR